MASPEWFMEQLFQNERDGRSTNADDVIADYVDRQADLADRMRQQKKDEQL